MSILDPNFEDFLKFLNENQVKYIIVGGYAVGYHGFVRATGDLDVFVESSAENARRLVRAYVQFGFREGNLPESLFLEKGNIVRIGVPPTRIEVMNEISGVDFASCYERAIFDDIGDVRVPFIDYDSLIENKKASGRPKDLIDIEGLRESEST